MIRRGESRDRVDFLAGTRAILLRAENVALHFDRGATKALNGVNVHIHEGEFVAVVGPSGCGKSSLLNILGTLESPTTGDLYFRARPYASIRDASLFRRQHLGFIFQAFHLISTLSAIDNVLLPTIGASGLPSDYRARAVGLLVRLGLEGRLHHFPGAMSGGERQRVAIARALINRPGIILADEPTGSLDSVSTTQVLDLLTEMRKELSLTMVMVTHDPSVSSRADRIVRMRDGKIDDGVGARA